MRLKHQTRLIIVLASIAVVALPVFLIIIPANQPIGLPLDVDYITDGDYAGNFLVTDNIGKILIVNDELEVLWETDIPERFCHEAEILPNGNIIVADTAPGRVIEINISDPEEILWEWDPTNPDHINWTELALRAGWSQDALDYVQNPSGDWTHTNDAEWVNGSRLGRSYDSLMISVRNFNLIPVLTQRFKSIFQGYFIHMGTPETAKTQHLFFRILGNNIITHTALGQKKITLCRHIFNIINHFGRTTGKIGSFYNFRRTLGMCQHNNIWKLAPRIFNIFYGELIVYFTLSMPAN